MLLLRRREEFVEYNALSKRSASVPCCQEVFSVHLKQTLTDSENLIKMLLLSDKWFYVNIFIYIATIRSFILNHICFITIFIVITNWEKI